MVLPCERLDTYMHACIRIDYSVQKPAMMTTESDTSETRLLPSLPSLPLSSSCFYSAYSVTFILFHAALHFNHPVLFRSCSETTNVCLGRESWVMVVFVRRRGVLVDWVVRMGG